MDRLGFKGYAYVFMPGHVHILVEPDVEVAHDMGANGRDPLYNADVSEPVSPV